jgi:hypothetical protein
VCITSTPLTGILTLRPEKIFIHPTSLFTTNTKISFKSDLLFNTYQSWFLH